MMKLSKIAGSVFLGGICLTYAYGQLPQPNAKSELVGTWTRGYEDYQEFIYHKVERFAFDYLRQNPNSRMIARLCSKNSMAVALVNSYGFAYEFPRYGLLFKTPSDRFYFARSSKCPDKSEQYWFVPATGNIDFDELIPADKVSVKRWITSDYDGPSRRAARQDFEGYRRDFIAEMKKNPESLGFVIRNLKTNDRLYRESLRQIGLDKVEKGRVRVIRKAIYEKYYPEFMTVTIKD